MHKNLKWHVFDTKLSEFRKAYSDPTKETRGFNYGYQEFVVLLLERNVKLNKGKGWVVGAQGDGRVGNNFVGNIHVYFFSLFPFLGPVLNSF